MATNRPRFERVIDRHLRLLLELQQDTGSRHTYTFPTAILQPYNTPGTLDNKTGSKPGIIRDVRFHRHWPRGQATGTAALVLWPANGYMQQYSPCHRTWIRRQTGLRPAPNGSLRGRGHHSLRAQRLQEQALGPSRLPPDGTAREKATAKTHKSCTRHV